MTEEMAAIYMIAIVPAIIAGAIVLYRLIEGLFPGEQNSTDEVEAIDNELERLHAEMKSFVGGTHNSEAYMAYMALMAEVTRLNDSLLKIRTERDRQFFELEKYELELANR